MIVISRGVKDGAIAGRRTFHFPVEDASPCSASPPLTLTSTRWPLVAVPQSETGWPCCNTIDELNIDGTSKAIAPESSGNIIIIGSVGASVSKLDEKGPFLFVSNLRVMEATARCLNYSCDYCILSLTDYRP